jgi:hypothetical protein
MPTIGVTAVSVPVAELKVGDLVFDVEGATRRLASVRRSSDSSVWIQRSDLNYVEHLSGVILVIRPN